ncbi:unnamed protein product [Trichogramma brassicae]|uniref:Uncharacterized protein n=1 Tax=Trichogramma brassicae TaxID=86971 RepID=A0A6H5I142_9HYME|nr:unnamed protein product [Trichogramma brassicae]
MEEFRWQDAAKREYILLRLLARIGGNFLFQRLTLRQGLSEREFSRSLPTFTEGGQLAEGPFVVAGDFNGMVDRGGTATTRITLGPPSIARNLWHARSSAAKLNVRPYTSRQSNRKGRRCDRCTCERSCLTLAGQKKTVRRTAASMTHRVVRTQCTSWTGALQSGCQTDRHPKASLTYKQAESCPTGRACLRVNRRRCARSVHTREPGPLARPKRFGQICRLPAYHRLPFSRTMAPE